MKASGAVYEMVAVVAVAVVVLVGVGVVVPCTNAAYFSLNSKDGLHFRHFHPPFKIASIFYTHFCVR